MYESTRVATNGAFTRAERLAKQVAASDHYSKMAERLAKQVAASGAFAPAGSMTTRFDISDRYAKMAEGIAKQAGFDRYAKMAEGIAKQAGFDRYAKMAEDIAKQAGFDRYAKMAEGIAKQVAASGAFATTFERVVVSHHDVEATDSSPDRVASDQPVQTDIALRAAVACATSLSFLYSLYVCLEHPEVGEIVLITVALVEFWVFVGITLYRHLGGDS